MALIFLISGLSIPRYLVLFIPALVLAVVHAILAGHPHGHIDPAVLAGYILTACIPTTIASNVVITRSVGGDDATALVEVLIATFLGPFVTAAWTVTVLPDTEEFEPWRDGGGDLTDMYRDVFKQLGLSVAYSLGGGTVGCGGRG
ncbi:hypothetical protein BBP40_000184 [Aspergillus hancockii]|nr:hypothetical protein BBP40_000184 [Aspergillus hancockii]